MHLFTSLFTRLLILLLYSTICLSKVLPRNDVPKLVLELEKDTRIEYIHAGRFGNLLISTLNSSDILEFDPLRGSVEPLLPSPLNCSIALSGIATLNSSTVGTFIVSGGQLTSYTTYDGPVFAPDSVSLYQIVCLTETSPCEVQKQISISGNINDMTTIPGTQFTFHAGTANGRIMRADWSSPSIDITTAATGLLGVNDIKYRNGYMYFTSTLHVYYQRIKVDPKLGFQSTKPEILAIAPVVALMGYDGFDFDSHGYAYLVVGQTVLVSPGHGVGTFIQDIRYPSSVAVSFDDKTVYVSTAEGKIFAMDALQT